MSELSEQHIAGVMQQYVDAITDGRLDDILELFADDAVVEDPVDSEPCRGRQALREFYQLAVDSVDKMVLDGHVRARGKWGACAMLAYPKGTEGKMTIETLDVMEFNQAGQVVAMTAYFGDSNIRMDN